MKAAVMDQEENEKKNGLLKAELERTLKEKE